VNANRVDPGQGAAWPSWFSGTAVDDDASMPVGQREKLNRERAEATWALEWDLVRRIRDLNIKHAMQAWELRNSMPLAPHVVAFLYYQLSPRGTVEVRAAWKMWHAGVPDAGRPVQLIATLAGEVTEVLDGLADDLDDTVRNGRAAAKATSQRGRKTWSARPVWDVRAELCDAADDDMKPDAVYAGIAYSTLDTAAASFAQVCQQARTYLEVPGAFCYVSNPSGRPEDHRVLTAERAPRNEFATTTIHSHGALSSPRFESPFPYSAVSGDLLYGQNGPYQKVLRALWRLDQQLRAVDATQQAREDARVKREEAARKGQR
jgi:hypothetical protein